MKIKSSFFLNTTVQELMDCIRHNLDGATMKDIDETAYELAVMLAEVKDLKDKRKSETKGQDKP